MFKHTPRLSAWLLAVALSTPLADAAADSADSLVTDNAIFVAANGITRYDTRAATRSWSALAGRRISGLTLAARYLLAGASDGIHGLAADTGEPLWRVETQTPAFAPMVYRRVAYAGTQGGVLLALDPASGRPIWERRFEGWVYPPAIAGGHLIVGGSGTRLSGIDPDNGVVRWQRPLDQELVFRPVQTAADRVVVTTFAGTVMALSGAGSPVWTIRDPAPSLSPTVAGGRLFLAGLDGVLRVRDARDGRFIWRRKITDRFIIAPAVTAQTVLMVHGRTLTALDIDTGRPVRTQILPFFPTTAPGAADGRFVLFPPDGRPYIFDPGETPGGLPLSTTHEGVIP